MREIILREETKTLLLNLEADIEAAKSEGTKRFFKVWVFVNIVNILIQVILKNILSLDNINLISNMIGYILGNLILVLYLIIIKKKTGSITGINYFERYKEKILLDITFDLSKIMAEIKYGLIIKDIEKDNIRVYSKLNLNEYYYFCNFLSSKEYKGFKNSLILGRIDEFNMLVEKENLFKEKLQDLYFIQDLSEKELNEIKKEKLI